MEKIDKTNKTGGQDEALKIPEVIRTNEETTQDSRKLFLVEDIPVLCLVSKGNDSKSEQKMKSTKEKNTSGDSLQLDKEVQRSNDNEDLAGDKGKIISTLKEQRKDQSNEGWTQINRHKKKMDTKESRLKSNNQSLLQIHASKLRQQRKCFNCLLEGHIKAICKNSKCCLYCNKTGHIIRDCHSRLGRSSGNQREKPIYKREPVVAKGTPLAQNKRVPLQQNSHQKKNSLKNTQIDMAIPRDWLTMPMNEPVQLWQERPVSMDVYIAPRAELSPANLFLERSAFIFAPSGASDPYLN